MNAVKRNLRVAVFMGVVAASATAALGQVGQMITLDESGNGYITPSQPFAFTSATEPISGITTLRYTLPFAGNAGDVVLLETPAGAISDVLRFDGQSHVYFFSDNSDGVDSLADVGLPSTLITPNVTLLEQGPEGGFQYVLYTPGASDPGFKAASPGTTYEIISDVPEPSVTMMLGCLGGGLLLVRSWRHQAKRG